MTGQRTKLWYLKNLDMFSHMRDEEHKMIDKYAHMRDIKKGEILYLQGSSDKNIYLLKKGTVKITKLTPHGKEIIIDIFKGGSIFGEMTVIEPHERDESAEVIEDGLICTMTKDNFDRLIHFEIFNNFRVRSHVRGLLDFFSCNNTDTKFSRASLCIGIDGTENWSPRFVFNCI